MLDWKILSFASQLQYFAVYFKAGSRARAIWSDVTACLLSAALFYILPFRRWLGQNAFQLLTLCPFFMGLPSSVVGIVEGTLLMFLGFMGAAGLGILGFVLVGERTGLILLFFF
mmetsp:Transcript_11952/g.24352  ORF Transcript_11952/g.24352 Transcript_11952/m.24352 type:complete len:114 (+) Transcript_11952:75-416(+)